MSKTKRGGKSNYRGLCTCDKCNQLQENRKVYARGVCNNAYQRYRYQVEVAGSTTWKKLENAGLVLPARRK